MSGHGIVLCMDTLPTTCPDTAPRGVRTRLDCGRLREAASGPVKAEDRERGHTPVRSVRMGDRWDHLEAVYGKRKVSGVLNEVAAWLLREPGAKLPPRAPLPERPANDS